MVPATVAIRPGGPLDWARVYQTHAPELARYLARLLGDADVASDAVQDVFVRAIRADGALRDSASVRPWLYAIASNVALKQLRRRRVLSFVPFLPVRDDEITQSPAPAIEAVLVKQVLRKIPAREAIAIVLHYQAGFSRREIAQIEGVSEEAIKSRLARGRRHFLEGYPKGERGDRT